MGITQPFTRFRDSLALFETPHIQRPERNIGVVYCLCWRWANWYSSCKCRHCRYFNLTSLNRKPAKHLLNHSDNLQLKCEWNRDLGSYRLTYWPFIWYQYQDFEWTGNDGWCILVHHLCNSCRNYLFTKLQRHGSQRYVYWQHGHPFWKRWR